MRDLVEIAINHDARNGCAARSSAKAEIAAEERVLDALVGEAASADTRSQVPHACCAPAS